ncbi:MAG: hypothetical protein MJ131_10985 [Lachnospiraceae bacterium]|nr:hypothetical protein [Lachnospiraceae bacterium]
MSDDSLFCSKCGKKTANTDSAFGESNDLPKLSRRDRDTCIEYLQAIFGAEERRLFFKELTEKADKQIAANVNKLEKVHNSVFDPPAVAPIPPRKLTGEDMNNVFLCFVVRLFYCPLKTAIPCAIFAVILGIILDCLKVLNRLISGGAGRQFLVIFGISCGGISALFIILSIFADISENKKKEKTYQNDLEVFNISMEKYKNEYLPDYYLKEKKFLETKKLQEKRMVEDIENNKKNIKELSDRYEKAEKELKYLFDMGILYVKYRNLQACSYFIQYFMSGRCQALEGPFGCYNLYEHEQRMDKIIYTLTEIRGKIYEVVDALNKINYTISNSTKSIIEVLKKQNEMVVDTMLYVNNNMERFNDKLGEGNAILQRIEEVDIATQKQIERYNDYYEFALRQKRLEEGHLY